MKNTGNYYGATLLKETDLTGTKNQNNIMLEYYGTKTHSIEKTKIKTFYGIKIVKKEYGQNEIKSEQNSIGKISTNENIIKNIIETLKTNKVTPIALNDVLSDLLKQPQYQGK